MAIFRYYQDENEFYGWYLFGDNQELIASSGGMYQRKESCAETIEMVRQQAAGAGIIDDLEPASEG
ncbi:MAG TPA: YegP family protein [Pyrinomonadaceae bacterium]|jgi:uncharacterized protein YegP (UPF0339 family)